MSGIGVLEDEVERRDAVAGHHQQAAVGQLVEVAHLAASGRAWHLRCPERRWRACSEVTERGRRRGQYLIVERHRSGRPGLGDRDVPDRGVRRAVAAPVDHGVDGVVVSLEVAGDGLVGLVADPARDAETLGLLHGVPPEGDALDAPGHPHRHRPDHAASLRSASPAATIMGAMWNDLMHLGVSVPDKIIRTVVVYLGPHRAAAAGRQARPGAAQLLRPDRDAAAVERRAERGHRAGQLAARRADRCRRR